MMVITKAGESHCIVLVFPRKLLSRPEKVGQNHRVVNEKATSTYTSPACIYGFVVMHRQNSNIQLAVRILYSNTISMHKC